MYGAPGYGITSGPMAGYQGFQGAPASIGWGNYSPGFSVGPDAFTGVPGWLGGPETSYGIQGSRDAGDLFGGIDSDTLGGIAGNPGFGTNFGGPPGFATSGLGAAYGPAGLGGPTATGTGFGYAAPAGPDYGGFGAYGFGGPTGTGFGFGAPGASFGFGMGDAAGLGFAGDFGGPGYAGFDGGLGGEGRG